MPGILDPRERRPTKVQLTYGAGGVAPHIDTQRWTYTVPGGRSAILEITQIEIIREAAAAPLGFVNVYLQYTPSGAASQIPVIGNHFTNAAGDRVSVELAPSWLLLAGDNLQGRTGDGGAGGAMRLRIGAVLTEFDA